MSDSNVVGAHFAEHELEQLECIVLAFERVQPKAHERMVEYLESRYNGGRLQAIERAATQVYNGLNRRIDIAAASGECAPVFDGIVALHDSLQPRDPDKARNPEADEAS